MNFKIAKPTMEQIDKVADTYWKRSTVWRENRYGYIWFVAVDSEENVIGHLVLEEKEIPIPPFGKDWFILTIVVEPEYRCRGIGTELVKHAFAEAGQLGVRNFQGSANPTKEAHYFWLKNKFCFYKYGAMHNDPSKKDRYGNYSHIIFRRVDNAPVGICNNSLRYKKATREQIYSAYSSYIEKECVNMYHGKQDEIDGITAYTSDGEEVGITTWLETPLMPPLDGKQWCIPYVYVKPEFRNKGISKGLLEKLFSMAKENGVVQLFVVHRKEDIMPYWYSLGFDVFVVRYLFKVSSGNYFIGFGKNITRS